MSSSNVAVNLFVCSLNSSKKMLSIPLSFRVKTIDYSLSGLQLIYRYFVLDQQLSTMALLVHCFTSRDRSIECKRIDFYLII